MEITINAQLLTAESKPYKIDGNEGVSHKVRLNVGGEIFVAKSTAEQVEALKSREGSIALATFRFESRKESLSMKLVSFAE